MNIQDRVTEKYMKVHSTSRDYWKFEGCPEKVPYSLLNAEQAIRNHDQTLDRLNERGGMGVLELLDNIHKRRLSHGRESIQHLEELKEILARLIPEAKPEYIPGQFIEELFKNIPKGKYDQHYKGTAPIVEESQDQLWMSILTESAVTIETIGVSALIRTFKERYHITRKP